MAYFYVSSLKFYFNKYKYFIPTHRRNIFSFSISEIEKKLSTIFEIFISLSNKCYFQL